MGRFSRRDRVDVEVGQVWADGDPRNQGRTVTVERVESEYAYCVVTTLSDTAQRMFDQGDRHFVDTRGRKTRLSVDAMTRLTRWRLVRNADGTEVAS